MKVKKAVIPVAGLGTRGLPATKAIPKEMFPLVDKPAIQYIVEEALLAGIEEIIMVTSRNKKAIEDHFDHTIELEHALRAKGKMELLSKIEKIPNLADIHFIRQKQPLGLGHAILCARSYIKDEPFAVLLGDDILMPPTHSLMQMMHLAENKQRSVIAVQPVLWEEVSQYGIVRPIGENHDLIGLFSDIVEKPSRSLSPSNIAVMGRYVLTPDIFEILSQLPVNGGEYQLTDALQLLNQSEPVLTYSINEKRYDIGNKVGYVKATIDFALKDLELNDVISNYIKNHFLSLNI